MARKANIAKEEIYQACWELIEAKQFPNIPRLTEHFLQKDGRRCSNTTFMNAIAEWEEHFKDQQQHELKELDGVLLPIFHRFSREVTQNLGQLLDEKTLEIEEAHQQKQHATNGSYLSLSSALVELQKAYDLLQGKHIKTNAHNVYLEQSLALEQQRGEMNEQKYQDSLSHSKVLSRQLKEEQNRNTELRINLSQKEVDLAKQDNKIAFLQEELATIKSAQEQKTRNDASTWQAMHKTLEQLAASLQDTQHKDRAEKQ